ncbi:MAG: efflux RND transporter periplasmic adaptor subunit [Deltaproteobacteria bacterium]|nr:efflux RND transporter periplasmic adaptor subunit [Deltaproteobacteria bacterium]MBM4322344.1 efflux RND transporter periplasmic adaptor subunit [Deltaproteobacteria bacterium]MBM4346744.1 efflux RND transporter periplasmic adaptor subunit [Deltaproteobacteria bacterium]
MKHLTKRWRWFFLIFILLVGSFALYRVWALTQKKAVPQRTKRGDIPVQVSPVVIKPLVYSISMNGDIAPLMQVDLFPKVSGYLERIYVNLGDSVKQGQTIAQLDRTDYLQKVREMEARVAQAKAQFTELEAGARAEELRQAEEAVRSARSRFENAKLHKERMEALYQRQVISKKEWDVSEMEFTVAEAQFASSMENLKLLKQGARQEVKEASQAKLKEAEAILSQERIRLQHTQIAAPFSGEISKKYVDGGALVSSSTPIVNLVHTETLKVTAHVLEKDIPLLKIGIKAKVRTESSPGKVFEGKIARISSTLDPATRTLQAEIEIPNSERLLKPSMFARIEVVLGEKPRALLIPRYAIVLTDGSKAIFIVKGNQAIRRPVVTGYEQEQYVEILEGASEGDQVIVKGQELIKDRSTVRVIEGS